MRALSTWCARCRQMCRKRAQAVRHTLFANLCVMPWSRVHLTPHLDPTLNRTRPKVKVPVEMNACINEGIDHMDCTKPPDAQKSAQALRHTLFAKRCLVPWFAFPFLAALRRNTKPFQPRS